MCERLEVIDYVQKTIGREHYHYADFLKDCQAHYIHDDHESV